MKGVLVAFLLLVVLLLVTADAKKRGKEGSRRKNGIKPGMKELKCPRNCSDCEEGICLECDDGFALKTFRNNRTGCIPCGRRLKMKDPASFLQQCVNDCSRNCSACDNGNCQMCDPGFFKVQTRLLKRTVCVPCGPRMKRNWPDVFVRECKESELTCPRNCSDCEEGICLECDDGFALKTFRNNRTGCIPCGRRLKMKDPASFLQQCINDCSRNCSVCDNGNCQMCDPGFFKVQTRLLKRTVCVPCGPRMKRNWPDVFVIECTESGCGRGCANCTTPGLCTECEGDQKLFTPPGSNITRCVRRCPPFYKLEKGVSPPTCEFQQEGGKPNRQNGKCGKDCEQCTEEGVCEKCFKEFQFLKLRDRTICVRKCPLTLRKYFDPETNRMICGKSRRGKKGGRKNPLLSDI
ncbi:unnamed protein product [Pocillopora meandrina]|uniref:Uncharacterized protein n=1 Tax=Pocillopora meandrina TaxID=46732 RepID=A0AAU9XIZ7_9CNID|nr:unnamed protein product [Pocillopora meandrina]